MLNSSLNTTIEDIQSISSKVATKMVNSGQSVKQTQVVLVQGIVKLKNKVKLSCLNLRNGSYQLFHVPRK